MKTTTCILAVFYLLAACTSSRNMSALKDFPAFYKEGHRGTRGLMPENTIPSMIKAIEEGANMIEVDIYLTKDNKVLVAHDPYVNINHSLYADGKEISKED